MKTLRWTIGAVVLLGVLALVLARPVSFLLRPDMPFAQAATRALDILVLASLFCLYRVVVGPTAADRVVAIDIFGVLIVGICAILSLPTGRSWYIDIGIAWALQSFIGSLALSKYLEGKSFDE